MVNKRHDEAIEQLKKVAKWNRKTFQEVELEVPKEVENEKSDVRDLFYDRKISMITIASWISWFVDYLFVLALL